MQKIFISYSRKDMDFVRKLAGDLEKAGYDVWWDITDLRGGDDWVSTLPAAIKSSQFFIIVLTPSSVESEWVRKEYTQALSLRKKIIPIMLAACDVPFALNTINFVNFTVGEYADNYKNLLGAVEFTGEPPVVSPYKKAMRSLPPSLLKFGIPALIGLALLLVFAWNTVFPPPVMPTFTPPPTSTEIAPPTATHTLVSPTSSPTDTPTATVTPTATHTVTPTVTLTSSPTQPLEVELRICITAESPNVYVRFGPGQTYEPKILDLRDESFRRLSVCPWFSAQIYAEGSIWFLVATGQRETTLQEFEGGWIRQDLLDKNIRTDILPVVTLTPMPTASSTSTITPTETLSPTDTATDTPAP